MLTAFGSLSGHQPIMFAELMAILEGLDIATQFGFFVLRWSLISNYGFLGYFSWLHTMGFCLSPW